MDREHLAKEIFIADNGRLTRDAAEREWEAAGPAQRAYAYVIARALAPVIASHVAEEARATITAYVEAYPGFRDGWGHDPESNGARAIANKTVQWLRNRWKGITP